MRGSPARGYILMRKRAGLNRPTEPNQQSKASAEAKHLPLARHFHDDVVGFDFHDFDTYARGAGANLGIFAYVEGSPVDDGQPVLGRAGKTVELQINHHRNRGVREWLYGG